VDLFAKKGYTETSIRDIVSVVGINPGSLYNHFSSKDELLNYMLRDFANRCHDIFNRKDIPIILQEDPTPDGIISCFHEVFTLFSDEYLYKVVCVLFHEHHRNSLVRDFVMSIIQEIESYAETIIITLKNLKIIRDDNDPDFWTKTTSSVIHAYIDRTMMGFGEYSPGYKGLGMRDLILHMYEMLFDIYGVNIAKAEVQSI
jgi:AcrR family transcriptional regulator